MNRRQPRRATRRRLIMLCSCAVVLVAFWALSYWAWFVEYAYARGVSFQITRALSIVTGLIPISISAFAFLAVALYLVVPLVVTIVRIVRGERRWLEALGAGVLRVMSAAAVVAVVFYLIWGLNYSRLPLRERLGWPEIERPADDEASRRLTEEIAALATQLVVATNESYRAAAGSDDLGRPSAPPDPSRAVDAGLDVAFERVQQHLRLEPQLAARRGAAKPFLASALLNHFQLTGFFFPWTGEANYNHLAPAMSLPHTVAHERSHQRGIAREDEANFIGFLVCIASDDPFTRYSGYLFAQRQLLGELTRRDRERSRALVKMGSAGVWRDIAYISTYWQQFEGVPARLSATVNDTYLRSQGVRTGIASYAGSQNLIVLYARQHGGSIRIADR